MNSLLNQRRQIRDQHRADEHAVLGRLIEQHGPDATTREKACAAAVTLVNAIRADGKPTLMEVFLAEYGLSTDEGVALMCLAEALLRVPDAQTVDELIEDKIAPSSWGEHLGQSSSSLVNASTWALMLTGKVFKESHSEGLAQTLHAAIRRLGEPVIRTAARRAMQEMANQFVLGQSISEALANSLPQNKAGYTFSYDMLGEAALTADDADTYFDAYRVAIDTLSQQGGHGDTRANPGISIKLSALHPRYELGQRDRILAELVPRIKSLAVVAKGAQSGLNIDAEEAHRLDLSLDIIELLMRSPELADWDGLGIVVQAYGKRAGAVIDWLHELAVECDRKIMVRLVKGAYWDTEIKLAQVDGVEDFPVFTQKCATDVAYICCAQKLLNYSQRIYPQFATHNAHTVCCILQMASAGQDYEFQRLYGMGEALHEGVMQQHNTRCRIYAPVGIHRDLLAYLVRRLLENGANSSFVNQLVDDNVSADTIAQDPFLLLESVSSSTHDSVQKPADLYQPERKNSFGWDLRNNNDLIEFQMVREPFRDRVWSVEPQVVELGTSSNTISVVDPGDSKSIVGHVSEATSMQVAKALENANAWSESTGSERCTVLNRAADLYEENAGELFAALCREAGKTPLDAVAEIREAVDFLRFYGAEGSRLEALPARGIITCISPWNFPLAIFSGQIAAALAAGNGVLAKPADPTPIVASIGVKLLHEAGVPRSALQCLPGSGATVGVSLTTDPRVNGICFTGSTAVARLICQQAASTLAPDSCFIAETGGINAMIVDSTALPQQAIQDIVDSAFRSCGQRCSALRLLYVQEDVAPEFMAMLFGAMDELHVSDAWNVATDVGPVISLAARDNMVGYVETARHEGRLLKQLEAPVQGYFIGPSVISVPGILSMEKEVFGPVLHVTTFAAVSIDSIVDDINASGYGLTFGLHTRIEDRVERITQRLDVGNVYVNRNQIGAVVGSQPFGGEGLSGTGPKAGGPLYVKRFKRVNVPGHDPVIDSEVAIAAVQAALDSAQADTLQALDTLNLPGPTGESNRWSIYPRGVILCLGPTPDDVKNQMRLATAQGCAAVGVAPSLDAQHAVDGYLDRAALTALTGFDAVALWSSTDDLVAARTALARRHGALVPLIATDDMRDLCIVERHLCIDTTAAGGNASLLAAQ